MGQVEGCGDARDEYGDEPFVGEPTRRAKPDLFLGQFVIKPGQAALEWRSFEGDAQIAEPDVQERIVGEVDPRMRLPEAAGTSVVTPCLGFPALHSGFVVQSWEGVARKLAGWTWKGKGDWDARLQLS